MDNNTSEWTFSYLAKDAARKSERYLFGEQTPPVCELVGSRSDWQTVYVRMSCGGLDVRLATEQRGEPWEWLIVYFDELAKDDCEHLYADTFSKLGTFELLRPFEHSVERCAMVWHDGEDNYHFKLPVDYRQR
jgi:hypothetical protein